MKRINARARSKCLLSSITRELGFEEIAILTRAGQARALGLETRGHLGIGANADIAIYNVDPRSVDPATKYKAVRRAFKHAAYTIKSGEIVVKNDEITKHAQGATMWLDVQTSKPADITNEMKKKFREYWTVEYENYPVTENCLEVSHPRTLKADV
jgi:formylmethanofuran dehydrogenase subunit A